MLAALGREELEETNLHEHARAMTGALLMVAAMRDIAFIRAVLTPSQ